VRTLNLKEDMPTVPVAMARLERELALANSSRIAVVKIIHGYGSTGRGGDIRVAVQKALVERAERRDPNRDLRRGLANIE